MGHMSKVMGFAGTKAILALIAVVLMSQYSHIIFIKFTGLTPLSTERYLVTGRVRLRRTDNYLEWLGPEHLPCARVEASMATLYREGLQEPRYVFVGHASLGQHFSFWIQDCGVGGFLVYVQSTDNCANGMT